MAKRRKKPQQLEIYNRYRSGEKKFIQLFILIMNPDIA